VKKKRPPKERTLEALEQRRDEIKFLGTQFAMNGVDPPPDLEAEYREISEEIARRNAPNDRATSRRNLR
jgi:hypothetical protein